MRTNEKAPQLPLSVQDDVIANDEGSMEKEVNSSEHLVDGNYPVSKADRMRERLFRSRVHNTNKKYLKPYLKG